MSKNSEEKIHLLQEYGRRFSDATVMLHLLIAQKAGLAAADHKYLGILLQKGSMTAGELSHLTGLTTGAITGLVDRLEKKALVKRKADKLDRRKVLIVPNHEKAEKLFGGVFNALLEKMVAHIHQYSDTELETIKNYISETTEIMEEFADNLRNN